MDISLVTFHQQKKHRRISPKHPIFWCLGPKAKSECPGPQGFIPPNLGLLNSRFSCWNLSDFFFWKPVFLESFFFILESFWCHGVLVANILPWRCRTIHGGDSEDSEIMALSAFFFFWAFSLVTSSNRTNTELSCKVVWASSWGANLKPKNWKWFQNSKKIKIKLPKLKGHNKNCPQFFFFGKSSSHETTNSQGPKSRLRQHHVGTPNTPSRRWSNDGRLRWKGTFFYPEKRVCFSLFFGLKKDLFYLDSKKGSRNTAVGSPCLPQSS